MAPELQARGQGGGTKGSGRSIYQCPFTGRHGGGGKKTSECLSRNSCSLIFITSFVDCNAAIQLKNQLCKAAVGAG